VRDALDVLIERGLVMPNPGYGHPSRPEYVLTERGRSVAPAAAAIVVSVGDVADVAFKKWSLPVLAALEDERRYAELLHTVGATPRSLSLALKDLAAAGLVERRVHDGYPPSTTYLATARGRAVQRRVLELGVIPTVTAHRRSRA